MNKKDQKNKKKSEMNAMFFIILLALLLFIISTYAWFSTQKNVSITNLSGTVEVAEGLEISLDALNWSNGIVIGTDKAKGEVSILDDAYEGHRNIIPKEMLPVSTLGLAAGKPDVSFMRGKITNSKQLSEIATMDESLAKGPIDGHNSINPLYPGFFAFDVFLKNSSKTNDDDELQLNYDSSLEILESDKETTGLQNTARIAFAKYTGTCDVEIDDQKEILKATAGIGSGASEPIIADVAIWEPNANRHEEYIVRNNNKITWSAEDAKIYAPKTLDNGGKGFDVDTKIPTYALTNEAVGKEIPDIYVWRSKPLADEPAEPYVAKQNVLQTKKKTETDQSGVQYLVSTTDGSTKFVLAANKISRLRVYVWLEGQDVDCINYASHGGGIKVNIGLVKGSQEGATQDPVGG